jgi:PAS domain S-box-containing protein
MRQKMAETIGSNLLFSESPTGVLILDRAARIINVNPAGCKAFGRHLDRLKGTPFLEWIHQADRPPVEVHLKTVLHGEVTEWKTRIRRGDGLPRLQAHRAIPLRRTEGIKGAVLFLGEIEEVGGGRPETRQLQSFMETIPGQFLLTTDKSGKIRFSAGLERTHFLDSSSVLGAPYRQLLGGERDGEQNLDELLREVGAGNPWAGLQWHRRKDGGSFPAKLFASPHRDPKTGLVLGVLIVGQDDSASHRWRDQAERAEPLAQIGSLSTGIAQKISDALSSLEETVLKLGLPSGQPSGEAETIQTEISRFRRFLEAVAEFGNRGTLRRQPYWLPEILAEVQARFQGRLEAIGISPTIETEPKLPPVYADRAYLARILEILLENALDALEGTAEPFLRLNLSNGTDGVLLKVTNSSPALPEEWLSEIFDPFFTTKEGRPGLGLAVAQGMIRAHDGRLWAEMPEPGTLSLSMELPREAPDRVREFRPVPLNLSRAQRVLLVDGDEVQRASTREFLEKLGYEVQEAWSGRSALAQATSGQLPEIVITDLTMSDGSGEWFLEQLGRVSPRLIPRTVLLTGDPDHEAVENLSHQTGCPVVRKPIEPCQLLEVLDQVAMGP